MNIEPPNNEPPTAQIAAALQQARAKLKEARERPSEPLAIVGVGCRFPGAPDSAAYWRLLASGATGISTVPADRWDAASYRANEPKQAGKITSDRAGFIDNADRFDASFFGISTREAASLDPQHRLLFEVAWETLENAGMNPDRLRGERCGVFVGACSNDYLHLLTGRDSNEIDAYLGTGNAHSAAAGRLSYFLDWRGPAVAIDTACSSSLTAIHYAAQSLRAGECEVALAGGVNLMLSPELSINLSLSGMLSSFGLCRAFCFGGDGFVRGEGCGLVLLRRLGSALASGDRVLGVLRGTAVNQDGRSNGLTAPNGPAQQAVIRRALATSGLRPADIDYLEAHGTGTELGDPTEMGALGAVFAPGRDPERPLMVGSAKTNLGHLEGAAGVAGLIKACLALHHQQLPPHPFFDPHDDGPNGPNPHIDWSLPVAIPNRLTPWPRSEGRVRRAGVSSFGFGGTNAHAILEEAPGEAVGSAKLSAGGRPLAAGGDEDGNEDAGRRTHWVTLSAKTPAALDALAERYADALPGQLADASLAEIAYAANTGRAAMAERLAVRADSRAQLAERLRERGGSAHAVRGAAPRAATAGWLFGGQGGCRPGMGRGLYQRFEAFREEWDACEAALKEHWPRSLKTLCWEEPERLQAVDAQVALVAWQIALAALWRRWAGEPAWVAGHSLGELAAAVTAGVLDRDDALAIVCRRAALLDDLPQRGATQQRGAMLAVMAPAEEVEAALTGGLVVAAYNGPRQTVVSGAVEAIERFAAESPLRSKRLATTHAFHSPLIEPAADALAEACGGVAMHAPRLGLLSTLTGQPLQEAPPADYWARQMRRPVRFAEALAHAPADAPKLELSPTPVLRALVDGAVEPAAGWRDANDQAGGANSHAGGANDEADGAEAAAARLWVAGVAIDFRALHPPQRLAVALPNYPFQRQRHWFKPSKKKRGTADNGAGQPPHPLLGRRVELAIGGGDTLVFEADLAEQPWLEDHQLRGRPTLPATAVIEIAWAAGAVIDPDKRWRVEDLCLERPLAWDPEAEAVRVQTVLTRQPEGNHRVELFQHTPSRQTPSRHNDAAWRRTAHGLLTPEDRTNPPPNADDLLKAFGEAELETRDPAQHYADCHQAGLQYGPAFQAITSLQARSAKNGSPAKAKAHIKLQPNTPNKNYLIQPTITDAALQTIAQTIKQQKPNTAWVPKTVRKAVG
ncbi:MAG: type I polyketide synthase, partial [Planctomycetota bacterium]